MKMKIRLVVTLLLLGHTLLNYTAEARRRRVKYSRCGPSKLTEYDLQRGVCCYDEWFYMGHSAGACCGYEGFDTSLQMCCGGHVYRKPNANTGCCDGKIYERGVQQCCNATRIINSRTHRCCRAQVYDLAKQECCSGIIHNLGIGNRKSCCGKRLYDKKTQVCCAETLSERKTGEFTRCCGKTPYDSKSHSCCEGKTLPKEENRTKCCLGQMINPREEICCEGKVTNLKYGIANTACCRTLADGKSVLFNSKHELCCFSGVQKRVIEFAVNGPGEWLHEKEIAEERSRCCHQQAYDTKYQICCRGRVSTRKMHQSQRCCLSVPYNRGKYICCKGVLHVLYHHLELCCGEEKYDRRTSRCVKSKVVSLSQKPIWIG